MLIPAAESQYFWFSRVQRTFLAGLNLTWSYCGEGISFPVSEQIQVLNNPQ